MPVPLLLAGLISGMVAPAAAEMLESAPHPAVYLVSMNLRDGDTPVATPKLMIAPGQPAVVEIGDGAGHHYSVHLSVTKGQDEALMVRSSIDVVTGEGHYLADPAMTVMPGLPAAVMVGMEKDSSKPFMVDFTVDPLRRK